MIYLKILLLIILAFIVYQDFRFKAVSWIFFPVGFVLGIVVALLEVNLHNLLINSATILLFLIFQLAIIMLFTRLKYKKTKNVFNSVFGLGDILFLTMIVPFFSPINFLLYFILSLIFTLVTFILFSKTRVLKSPRVPLAGLQSMFLIIVIISQIICKFSFYNDFLILQYFIG
ncbi:MAG: hypothetical protein KQH79_12825 [Bacteroidetes bacterium]|nr:hypothetical protein [Bacteroidota bacterium]